MKDESALELLILIWRRRRFGKGKEKVKRSTHCIKRSRKVERSFLLAFSAQPLVSSINPEVER